MKLWKVIKATAYFINHFADKRQMKGFRWSPLYQFRVYKRFIALVWRDSGKL